MTTSWRSPPCAAVAAVPRASSAPRTRIGTVQTETRQRLVDAQGQPVNCLYASFDHFASPRGGAGAITPARAGCLASRGVPTAGERRASSVERIRATSRHIRSRHDLAAARRLRFATHETTAPRTASALATAASSAKPGASGNGGASGLGRAIATSGGSAPALPGWSPSSLRVGFSGPAAGECCVATRTRWHTPW